MKKIIGLVFIFIIIFLSVQYHQYQNDAVRIIKQRGIIYVGTTGDYQPMSYFDKKIQAYTGFDIALAEDMAKSLNVKIKYVDTTWPNLMNDTINNKFDVAISGITVTKERKLLALMSDGYLNNGKTILCRKEDENKFKSLDDVNRTEVRVMENPGGLNEKFARKYLPNAKIIIHDVNEEIPDLIAQGNADVMITEVMEALYYSNKNPKLAAPIADFPFTNGEIGILIPKKNKKLLKYANDFLKQEKDNGRLNELKQMYIYGNK